MKNLALTYRLDQGSTGGPGGVLATQQILMGNQIGDIKLEYLFKTASDTFFDWYAHLFGGAKWAAKICRTNNSGSFIAHDPGVAYMLALAGLDYSLVWHFQGSVLTQGLAGGHKLPPFMYKTVKKIEKVAFTRAKYVHFPSDGACEMYCSDEYRGCNKNDFNLGKTLYNTILPDEPTPPSETIKALENYNGITFCSIGTLTEVKGQDQVVDFFENLASRCTRNIRWVCVGQGILKDKILSHAQSVAKKYSNFSFSYIASIPHTDILHLLSLSDIYIMLHRVSIFDYATLEAMKNNCAVFLSRVGGNIDFNKEDNVVFIDSYDKFDTNHISLENIKNLKELNNKVFKQYFSASTFKKAYADAITDLALKSQQ